MFEPVFVQQLLQFCIAFNFYAAKEHLDDDLAIVFFPSRTVSNTYDWIRWMIYLRLWRLITKKMSLFWFRRMRLFKEVTTTFLWCLIFVFVPSFIRLDKQLLQVTDTSNANGSLACFSIFWLKSKFIVCMCYWLHLGEWMNLTTSINSFSFNLVFPWISEWITSCE